MLNIVIVAYVPTLHCDCCPPLISAKFKFSEF